MLGKISHKLTFSILVSILGIQAAHAQLMVPDNKLVNAWTKKHGMDERIMNENDAHMDESQGLLPMSPERMQTFDFEKAARWSPEQIEFYAKSYIYVMKNEIDSQSSPLMKVIGTLALGLGFDYHVEPSFRNGQYTRTDRYSVRPGFSVGLGESTVHPSYIVEYTFNRQFVDPKLAVLSLPYTEQNLPFNTRRALSGLKPGDIFTFKANLTILNDISYAKYLGLPHIGASATPYIAVNGGFQVLILRLPDHKIRFKVIALRKQEGGVRAELGFNHLVFSGASLVDDTAFRLIDLNIASLKLDKELNRAFVVDYVLDLSDKDVAAAFDEAMSQARSYNYVTVVYPTKPTTDVHKDMVTNMTALQALAKKDEAAGVKGRVTQLNDITSKSVVGNAAIKLGNNLINLKSDHQHFKTDLQTETLDGRQDKFDMQTNRDRNQYSFFYSLFSLNKQTQMTSYENEDQSVQGFAMSSQRSDKRFTVNELEQVKKELNQYAPLATKNLDFSKWQQSNTISNVRSRIQVIFTRTALAGLPKLNQTQISNLYKDYLQSINGVALLMKNARRDFGGRVETPEEKANSALEPIAKRLEKALNAASMSDKIKTLTELQNSDIFRRTGAGFLMSLTPDNLLPEGVRVDMDLDSTDHQHIEYSQGPLGPQGLFANLRLTEEITNDNGEMDLRLESESMNLAQ